MNKGRTLAEAFRSKEKVQFINVGQPGETRPTKADSQKAKVDNQQETPNSERKMDTVQTERRPATEESTRPAQRRPRKKSPIEQIAPVRAKLTHPVVPITIRFHQHTAEALRRASLERKLTASQPNTQ